MSVKHLSTGSKCPPLQAGVYRCYSMRFCPYAQRLLLVLAVKNIKHDVVNVNLKKKPEFLLEKNPQGKVPTLEKDGEIVYESMVTCEYLNEVHPDPPLYPSDPLKKAQDRMLIELWSKVSSATYKTYFANGDQQVLKQASEDIKAGVDLFEAELSKRNTKFYAGDKPGMLDYMIWPWAERLPVAQELIGDADLLSQDRFPKMLSWMSIMKEDPAVKTTYISPEGHLKYLKTRDGGCPDYDIEL
ncbi:pyrimidodiazepine synthase-like [Homarus americanus]|uniref:Pyrimidodiazepine synthase-like 1 n=1 Tax=Homarus americanus TaxID=6706 RepID=A0A8J5JSH1_HOMAM|nr:pyrimidodiazepine synthase-like [Homarus americanus]KAG7163320.1 Pyrimidodiazepine synthase-like 1 [Homarus americanus]